MEKILSYETWDDQKVKNLNQCLKSEMDAIKWAFKEYRDDIIYASSFGAEAIVLLDLISKVKKDAKIVFLDTNLHFPETYEVIEKVKKRYPDFQIQFIQPELSLKEQEEKYGKELWKTNPDLCCQIRKIEPLKKEIQRVKAWMSGLRREQSITRKHVQFINKDEKFQSIKICPLIHWKWDDVWAYIQLNQLPYNRLHDQNYPSIGCAPCTLPSDDSKNSRAGRWAGFNKLECGLHSSS